MLCEKCKQREATVHRQVIINGVAHSEHLCAECAAKAQSSDPFTALFKQDAMANGLFDHSLLRMLAPFFQQSEQIPQVQTAENNYDPCPECGMTWEEFERNGFLGCDACYSHFKDALPPLLQRLHSETAETAQNANMTAPASAKAHLQAELTQAISDERFEDAAHLRDAIRALEDAEKRDTTDLK